MASKSRFCLRLAYPRPDREYNELIFTDFVFQPSDAPAFTDPIMTPVCGEKIDYGSLFAYLFRRFGYPNSGWDGYKHLARYILTTPHPDLFLSVTPSASNRATLSLRFLMPREEWEALDADRRRDLDAWRERAYQWRERQGLPDWARALRSESRSEPESGQGAVPQTLCQALMAAIWEPGDTGVADLALAFMSGVTQAYHQIEPKPPSRRRVPDWSQWADDDPLKPLAKAAQSALRDLHHPVRIRDTAINAFGRADFDYRLAVKAPAVAGHPSGDLGNRAPEAFAELHGIILELGKGNAKRGLALAKKRLTRR